MNIDSICAFCEGYRADTVSYVYILDIYCILFGDNYVQETVLNVSYIRVSNLINAQKLA